MVNTVKKTFDSSMQSTIDSTKTVSKKQKKEKKILKIAEATGDLIDNEIDDKITKVLRTSP